MTGQTKSRRAKPRPDSITCRRVTSLIAAYLGGELDPEAVSAIEAHVRDCHDCIAFLNTYRKSVEATHRLRYDTLPPELQERALKVIQQKIVRRPRRRA
jgi:anti-sigma factor RsiW